MATDYVFFYDSSMNRSELRSWLEAGGYDSSLIINAEPAKLEAHDFVWNYYSSGKAGGTANLEHKEGSTIWGALVEFEEPLLKAFDRRLGHPTFYSRGENRVPVQRVSDGKTVFAWLYVAAPNKGDRRDVWPTREYKKVILDAATFWKFPEDYIGKIKGWQTA
jgi:gamma-glutamylcyclotransferase (GGCT)/AIG2-like uncharacterized protein YtfP